LRGVPEIEESGIALEQNLYIVSSALCGCIFASGVFEVTLPNSVYIFPIILLRNNLPLGADDIAWTKAACLMVMVWSIPKSDSTLHF
jgi:hypothetical protein